MGPKAQTACLGNEKRRRVETGLHPGAGRLPHSLGRAIKTSRKAPLALLGASAFEELVARMRGATGHLLDFTQHSSLSSSVTSNTYQIGGLTAQPPGTTML